MTDMIRVAILVVLTVCVLHAVNLLEDISGTLRIVHIELHHLNWDK